MDKTKFLLKLESRLSILEEKERIKVLKKYASLIDEQVKAGKTEEEAVKGLGSFDSLVQDILKSYKIDGSYINKEKDENSFEGMIDRFVNFVMDGIKKVINNMQTKDFRYIFEIVLYILIAIFAFWVLRLPFYIVEAFGRSLFNVFDNPLSHILGYGWSFMINICYVLIIVWIVVIILNKFRKKDVIGENKHNYQKVEPAKESREASLKHVPFDIISALIKALIVIVMLPFFFMQAGIVIVIGVIIALMVEGVVFVGPLLVAIGLLIVLGSIVDLIFCLTFNRGGRE